jgi:hypothetical protein
MNAPSRPQDPAKFRRYRERMKARGLKEVRIWVRDPSAPGFAEEMRRQADLLREAPEQREALDFIEAAGAWGDDEPFGNARD